MPIETYTADGQPAFVAGECIVCGNQIEDSCWFVRMSKSRAPSHIDCNDNEWRYTVHKVKEVIQNAN